MTNETFDTLEAAISSGIIQESELMDLVSRGRQRAKQATLDVISKAIDEGADPDAILASVVGKKT